MVYETAVNHELNSLQKICLDFAANDWKTICKSNEFDLMNEKLSQQMLSSLIAYNI